MAKKRRRSKDITVMDMHGLGTAVLVAGTKRGRRFLSRELSQFPCLGSMKLAYTRPRNEHQTLRSLAAVFALAEYAGVTLEVAKS